MKARPQGWRWQIAWVFALVLCLARSLDASAMGRLSEKVLFNIDAGAAALRLNEFGAQAEFQLVYDYEDMQGVTVAAVHGEYKPFDALRIMLKGTDVTYLMMNRNTVTFRRASAEIRPAKALLQKTVSPKRPKGDRRTSDAGLEEVTISTDHQSILATTGSPVVTVGRSDIDATGFVTVQGVVRTLPQIFGGGPTEDTPQIGLEARTNTSRGTGVNLRGLGAGSTLVLMNGRRLPGGGSEGVFVDISNLPLAAIERIDILPDNSSTFYGADAVGGVANFVMRDDFKGRQIEAYIGDSTRGGFNENYISQLIGAHTASGHGVLALDFYSRDNLSAASRRQARSDLTLFGGSNFDLAQSNPGNIVQGPNSWAIPAGQDGASLDPASLQRGTQNLQNQYLGADILPSQQRWSGFGTWRQELTENLAVFADTLFGQRDVRSNGSGQPATFLVPPTNPFYVNPTGVAGPVQVQYNFLDDLGPMLSDARVRSANFSGGIEYEFDGGWKATVSAGYAAERIRLTIVNQVNPGALNAALASTDPATAFNPFGDGSHTNPTTLESLRASSLFTTRSGLSSAGVLIGGPVAALPGGDLEISFGGDARKQAFRSVNLTNATLMPTHVTTDTSREIRSGFAELRLPIVGPANRFRGVEALSLSLAERYERYSDFGRTLAPRLGLSWAPIAGVTVRGSYSDSFRPPGLLDLDEGQNSFTYVPLRDAQTGKTSMLLVWAGKNRDLREETARSWTAGLEFEPIRFPALEFAVTYFSTDFTNRLNRPTLTPDILTNPALSALVTLSPAAEYRADVCSRAPQAGSTLTNCLAIPVVAIADLRVRNDAMVNTRGVDALARYAATTRFGRFSFGLNGTYLIDFAEAKAVNLPLQDRVSTPTYPINLKMRGSARWQVSGFDVSAYVNYLNSYTDTVSLPARHVNSWTTVDLHASFTPNVPEQSWLGDTTVSLGVDNLLDADPPFLNNSVGIGYDQENGDLTGRMMSITVRKKW